MGRLRHVGAAPALALLVSGCVQPLAEPADAREAATLELRRIVNDCTTANVRKVWWRDGAAWARVDRPQVPVPPEDKAAFGCLFASLGWSPQVLMRDLVGPVVSSPNGVHSMNRGGYVYVARIPLVVGRDLLDSD